MDHRFTHNIAPTGPAAQSTSGHDGNDGIRALVVRALNQAHVLTEGLSDDELLSAYERMRREEILWQVSEVEARIAVLQSGLGASSTAFPAVFRAFGRGH
jgi:hypothetical protein